VKKFGVGFADDYIIATEGKSLLEDYLKIKRILVATINTAKQNNE